MYNILFISNDKRVGGIISYLQPLLKGTIHCTSDFDLGLKDIFDKRPALVFIQKKIGNVAGDVVAKHIKGLLRNTGPRLVLLQDQTEGDPILSNVYDDTIGFILPEPDIYKAFFTYLKKQSDITWVEDAGEKPDAQKVAVQAEGPDVSAAPIPKQKPAEKSAASTGATRTQPIEAPAVKPGKAAGGTAQFAASAPTQKQPARSMDIPRIPYKHPNRVRRWIAYSLVPVVMAAGVYLLYRENILPQQVVNKFSGVAAVAAPAKVAAVNAPEIHLPAVIVMTPADTAFAAANPGWERYQGEQIDFRVFREQGRIKVIQGICRSGGGLENKFIEALLRDLTGNGIYSIGSTSAKNGYVVERGSVNSNVELIVYRQEKTKAIKGFVISFS